MPHSLGLLVDKAFLIYLKQGLPRQSVEGISRLRLKLAHKTVIDRALKGWKG